MKSDRKPLKASGNPSLRAAGDGSSTQTGIVVVTSDSGGAPALNETGLVYERPWGHYQSVATGERHQVKHIVVKPGERLSLQRHFHRSEHWVVVRGTAEVSIGDEIQIVHENQSVYVPIGVLHRIENPGRIDLEIIEVQTGSYLGEDDIVRIEDVYGRV